MTTQPDPNGSSAPSVPPPLPEAPQQEARLGWKLTTLLTAHFWWILAGAALIKLVAYFIAPQPPSTVGGHIGALLRGFIVFGVSLSIVALIACQFFREGARKFRVVFAGLFALACLVNLPSACALRYAYTNVSKAAAEFAAAASASSFEALMKYEDNPFIEGHQTISYSYSEFVVSDAEKYFKLSYCYATGFDGYPTDIPKAIQLCQKAACENGNDITAQRARKILKKAGLSWPTEDK